MNRPSPDDMKAMQVIDYVTELEMENKKLKEKEKEFNKCKQLFNIRLHNGRDEFLQELIPLMQD